MESLLFLKQYVLSEKVDIDHPLFTYFLPKYEIHKGDNPYIKISLVSKLKGIEVINFIQYYKEEKYYTCAFCEEPFCKHFSILISYLFTLPQFVDDLNSLEEYFQSFEKHSQQKLFNEEINKTLKEINEDSQINKIHIEPHFFDARNAYHLEIKIGLNKTYKVPSLERFISYFTNEEVHRYGKDLEIVHKLKYFDEPSKVLIRTLQRRLNSYLTLNKEEIDAICDGYKGDSIYIEEIPYQINSNPISYHIKVDDKYRLSLISNKEDLSPFGKKYYIDNEDKIIHKYDYDNNIANLLDLINKYPLADIKDTLMDFKYSYLYHYPDIFEVDGRVQKELENDQFIIKTYLDYEDGKILLDYKLFFDGNEISQEVIPSYTAIKIFNAYMNIIRRYGFNEKNQIDIPSEVFAFLNSSLLDLHNISKVYISENLSNKKISTFAPPSINVRKEGSVLSVFLKDSIYSEEELKEIFLAIKKKKKYILINDNYLDISNAESEEFYNAVDALSLFTGKKITSQKHLPLYFAFKKLGLSGDAIEIDEYIDKALSEVKNYPQNPVKIPKINGKLRNYQSDGVKWLYALYNNSLGGILADDMGLGKTIEAIAFIKLINSDKPHLIVCPKSLVFNWMSEFKKFYPEMKVVAINGTAAQRKEIINKINPNEKAVYFISYDSLRNEINNLKDINFDLCILDEAQFIKNAFAKKTDAVKSIKADHHFALTGTPIENNIYDMWSIFDFLMPGYLGELKYFQEQYEGDEKYKERLKTIISPFILRRRKMDVLKDLPEKYEVLYTVDMTIQQRKIYDAYILNAKQSIKDASSKDMIKIFSLLTRLRQISVHPSLFVENYNGGSGKINALKDIVINKIAEGHRILVFSQFVTALDLLKQELDNMKINYLSITGDTSAKDRLDICNSFNNDDNIKMVLISLKAGGTGLNLIGADTVIHLDPWWNLAAENQASDRAHRIGQTRAVEVIKLISENSIEQRVIELQNEKHALVEMMISDNEESIKKLSIDEIKSLLTNLA